MKRDCRHLFDPLRGGFDGGLQSPPNFFKILGGREMFRHLTAEVSDRLAYLRADFKVGSIGCEFTLDPSTPQFVFCVGCSEESRCKLGATDVVEDGVAL